MNYLAHIFLSGSNRKVQLGNFVGDAVKGSSYKNIRRIWPRGFSFIALLTTIPTIIRQSARLCIGLSLNSDGIRGVLLDIYFDYLLASPFRVVFRGFLEEVYPDFFIFPFS